MRAKQKVKKLPFLKPLLKWDLNGVAQKHTWLYRDAIEMVSNLSNCVSPEIQMAVHQTA
jgi:hypothetical protein